MAARDTSARIHMYIGVFVVSGVMILAALVFMWNTPRGLLTGHYYVRGQLKHVGAVSKGAPVRMAGIHIGQVEDMALDQDGRDVLVTLRLNDNVNLRANAALHVATSGMVGEQFIEVTQGDVAQPFVPKARDIADAGTLTGDGPIDVYAAVASAKELIDQVKVLVSSLNGVIGDPKFQDNLRGIASNMDTLTAQGANLLAGTDAIVAGLQRATDNVVKITEQAGEVMKTAGGAVDKIGAAAGRVDDAVAALIDEKTVAAVKVAVDDAASALAGARTLVDGFGKTAAALTPEKVETLYADARTLIENVNALVGQGGAAVADVRGKIAAIDGDVVTKAVGHVGDAAQRLREIFAAVDPKEISGLVTDVGGFLREVTVLGRNVLKDPAKALAINKFVDRYVEQRTREWTRGGVRNADDMEAAIKREWRTMVRQEYLPAPGYENNPADAPHLRP